LYTTGPETLVLGSQTFSGGAVTFTSLSGLVTLGPTQAQTMLLVFDLNMSGLGNKNFSNSLATGGSRPMARRLGRGRFDGRT